MKGVGRNPPGRNRWIYPIKKQDFNEETGSFAGALMYVYIVDA